MARTRSLTAFCLFASLILVSSASAFAETFHGYGPGTPMPLLPGSPPPCKESRMAAPTCLLQVGKHCRIRLDRASTCANSHLISFGEHRLCESTIRIT